MLRLKELRLEAGKTQAELAQFLGISRQVYANYENAINEPSLSTLVQCADIFQCSLDFLLGREDDFGNVTTPGVEPPAYSWRAYYLFTYLYINIYTVNF